MEVDFAFISLAWVLGFYLSIYVLRQNRHIKTGLIHLDELKLS